VLHRNETRFRTDMVRLAIMMSFVTVIDRNAIGMIYA